jgi:putative heme degradation protein
VRQTKTLSRRWYWGALKAEIKKGRTAAIAATCTLTDAELILADLTNKSMIMDSQIEHLHGLIARLEAIAEAWAIQVKRVADISHFDVQLQKLTAAIFREAAASKKDPWDTVS